MGLCGTSSTLGRNNMNLSIINEEDSNYSKNISQKEISNNEIFKEQNVQKNLDFNFKAIIGEKELSIYITKNSKIEISFYNNSKWSFFQNEEFTDYSGNSNYKYKNFNIGCLLVRISTSKKYNNPNKNKIKFIAEESGSLIFKPNLDPNYYSTYEPKGSISLTIIGGKFVAKRKIDELTGYKYLVYGKTENEKCFSLSHKEISRYINKARSNIKKYINDFILDFKDKNFNMDLYNDLPLCKIDNLLYNIAEEHCQDLCFNGTSGHIGTDGNSFQKRLEKYIISDKFCAECIVYGIDNPILIVNSLIVDKYSKNKENRKKLLNNKYSKIGISLNRHISFGYCCVIIFQE